ncbi:MAG: helix-turn-helix domain-containing protein [Myxococcota bacterium]
MIKNEREYRITRAQAERFQRDLESLGDRKPLRGVDPDLPRLEAAALRSQLEELREQLAEYEALRAGQRERVEIESLDELPRALIQARIAAGMSQEDLAQGLGLSKQQIQRYEATDYASASLKRLRDIAEALNLQVHGVATLPKEIPPLKEIFRRLREEFGLERDFILDRLLPSTLAGELDEVEEEPDRGLVLRVVFALRRIFEWSQGALVDGSPLSLAPAAIGAGRFKTPKTIDQRRFVAYATYAHRLASFTLAATADLLPRPIPTDPEKARQAILEEYGEVTFESALRWVWSLGIAVLPLRDSGLFHGACWRLAGRNVLVLKQPSRAQARWLHDLLHEAYHAGMEPDIPERSVVEEGDPLLRRDEGEEGLATEFATDVVLAGRAEELVARCVEVSGGDIRRFKRVVPEVAKREAVPADALANYMAYRLSLQEKNWWGTATNLQVTEPDPWETARNVFFEHVHVEVLDSIEQEILTRGLSEVHAG